MKSARIWRLNPGDSLCFEWRIASPDHSTVVINMTNLNQIDKDLKALTAQFDLLRNDVAERIDSLRADLSGALATIAKTLQDISGGPSDDETQAKIDELTAKLREQEEKLKNAVSPDAK